MRDVVVETMGVRVFAAGLFTVFGVAALLLAAVGVFSVLAYLVEQRTREIGIRLALGSSRAAVRRLVAQEASVLAGVGLVVGGAVALMSGSVIEGMLFGVSVRDPMVLGVFILVAAAGAAAAAWLPARRATRVDPMIAMREECAAFRVERPRRIAGVRGRRVACQHGPGPSISPQGPSPCEGWPT